MKYQFGAFELCDESLLLTKKKTFVHIEPLTLSLLILLVQSRDRCILREEFFEALWPNVYVSDGSLSNEIKTLRKLLGDSGQAQTYIRTVRRRGYQFVGQVECISSSSIGGDFSSHQLGFLNPTVNVEDGLPNLPIWFSGRVEEVTQLLGALKHHDLVTIQGAGGIGKTTLAISAAYQAFSLFSDGAIFIPLVSASSEFDVLNLICKQLNIEEQTDVLAAFESGQRAKQFLGSKNILVILDNCEHLPNISLFVEGLVSKGFLGKLCCTSRTPLKLNREYIFQLSGLGSQPKEPHLKSNNRSAAAELFYSMSHHSGHHLTNEDIASVESICSTLQGSPLGILLAHSWLHSMTLAELKIEIDRNIAWLETDMNDISERHQTIETLYKASVNSLDPKLRKLFQSLCLLPNGFSFSCASFSSGLTRKDLHILERLGLIRKDDNLGFSIHELIRQYGAYQLELENQFTQAMTNLSGYYLDWLNAIHDLSGSNIDMQDVDLINKESMNISFIKEWLFRQNQWNDLLCFWRVNQSANLAVDLQRLVTLLPAYREALELKDYHHLLYKVLEYCYTANIYHESYLPLFEQYLTIAKQRNHKGYIGLAYLELSSLYDETLGEQSEESLSTLEQATTYLYEHADHCFKRHSDKTVNMYSGYEALLIGAAGRCAIWKRDEHAAWKYNNLFFEWAKNCKNELHQTSAHWVMANTNFLIKNPQASLSHLNKCTKALLKHGLVLILGLRMPAYGSIAELYNDFEEAAKFIGRSHSIVEKMRGKPVALSSFCDADLLARTEGELGKKKFDELCVYGKSQTFQEIIDSVDEFSRKYGEAY